MAKGYLGEDRFYISVIDKWDEPTEEGLVAAIGDSIYVRWDGELTNQFIEARHFASRDAAVEFAAQYKKEGRSIVVRSLHLEIVGGDIGTLV